MTGLVPFIGAIRGPRPPAVPERPEVPYNPWTRTQRRIFGRDVLDLTPYFDAGRHVRRSLDRARGTG